MSESQSVSLDFDFKDLVAFMSVATLGSFHRAAHELYVSQPTITRSLTRLETAFGTRLFDRGPRGASLTAAGRTFLDRARRMIAIAEDLRKESAGEWTTSIHLGAAATAAGSYLAPFLAEWIPSHPDVRIQVIEDGAARLRKRLDDGECDLAIIAAPIPQHLEARPITRIGLRAHFPATHPLSSSTGPLELTELLEYPLLVNNRRFLAVHSLYEACEAIGRHPHIVYESSNGLTLAALAEAGMGVAVFSDSIDATEKHVMSRPVFTPAGVQIGFGLYIAWHRAKTERQVRDFGVALSDFTRGRRALNAPTR